MRDARRYFGVPWFLLGRWTRYLFTFEAGTAYFALGATITDSDLECALEPEHHNGPTGRPTYLIAHSWARLAPDVRTDLRRENVVLRLVDDGCVEPGRPQTGQPG